VLAAAAGCEEEQTGLPADEPCEAADECRGRRPSCVDLGDGVTRCQSMCLEDAECGGAARCLFPEGTTPGVCYRTCDEAEDCAEGGFACEPLVEDDEQGYCVLVLESP
jgi:hypothetical protein